MWFRARRILQNFVQYVRELRLLRSADARSNMARKRATTDSNVGKITASQQRIDSQKMQIPPVVTPPLQMEELYPPSAPLLCTALSYHYCLA